VPKKDVQTNSRISARQCLAHNLRRLRGGKGYSQEQLALESGLHRTFVAHVERGARNASLDNIEKLADALGVSCSVLLMESNGHLTIEQDKA
jgi:transcriptional regulator with XRE-family HTH domain